MFAAILWNEVLANENDGTSICSCFAAVGSSSKFDFMTLIMRMSYLSRYKHWTNVPRLSNLTLVTVYLGKSSNINTASVITGVPNS